MLPGKPKIPGHGVIRAGEETTRIGEGIIRAGFLMPPHPFKYESISKINLNLMVFTQEIIYLK